MLVFHNISRVFGKVQVLHDVSLSVESGQIHALIGHNGAGKTTLIKIALGFLQPLHGTVEFNGLDTWNEKAGAQARSHMGVLFESNGLFHQLSALENLEIIARINRIDSSIWLPKCEKLLEAVELSSHKNEIVKNWSAGMKRKLSLIRCFIHTPQIVILDEPTAGLDPASKRSIRKIIAEERKQGTSFLIASQDLHDVDRTATHVTLLQQGSVLFSGNMDTFKSNMLFKKFRFSVQQPINVFLEKTKDICDVIESEEDQLGHTLLVKIRPNHELSDAIINEFSMVEMPISLEEVYANYKPA
ncbi:MAG: ABC transporter ATP-binding protein [Planctomycetaceae bacterium]|jgi:ABC-type multidrug transport system ATPase subunit|nr:ABC transporter ATP-binding protein [Planctomycetaceae bacterium]